MARKNVVRGQILVICVANCEICQYLLLYFLTLSNHPQSPSIIGSVITKYPNQTARNKKLSALNKTVVIPDKEDQNTSKQVRTAKIQ